jgi:GDP-mannose 6-dehydrogenase
MNISIFGMGYVGIVTGACLAKMDHRVIGVDISDYKISLINEGKSPIIEDDINEIIEETVANGRLSATSDAAYAIAETELAIICVGTPSKPSGELDSQYVEKVCMQIGELIRERKESFLFVIRSTVLPGTVRDKLIPILEDSTGRSVGEGYDIVFHPEFLREGTSIYDFYHPPKIVLGRRNDRVGGLMMDLYQGIESPRHFTSIETAEMVKYSDNLFHALKITFANEIGQLCHKLSIDSHDVMDVFCTDTKLNISARYLRPGFAFGGSCLPKDLRAFLYYARSHDLHLPMLDNVLISNQKQIERVLQMILAAGGQKIGFYGLSFKPGTDDLRESPLVELAERLLGKGKEILIFDEKVKYANLIGGNKSYVGEKLPHLASLLVEEYAELKNADVLLLGHPLKQEQLDTDFTDITIFDLTGGLRDVDRIKFQTIV